MVQGNLLNYFGKRKAKVFDCRTSTSWHFQIFSFAEFDDTKISQKVPPSTRRIMTDQTDAKAHKAEGEAPSFATKAFHATEGFLQACIHDPVGKEEAFGEPVKIDEKPEEA
jgi:hypothetical protein